MLQLVSNTQAPIHRETNELKFIDFSMPHYVAFTNGYRFEVINPTLELYCAYIYRKSDETLIGSRYFTNFATALIWLNNEANRYGEVV